MIAPADRSWAQQDRDRSECWQEAARRTGRDPMGGLGTALAVVGTAVLVTAVPVGQQIELPADPVASSPRRPAFEDRRAAFQDRYELCLLWRGYSSGR